MVELMEFQSTHPARGATGRQMLHGFCLDDFNPRTPRGVRLSGGLFLGIVYWMHFNPRTPRGVRPGLCGEEPDLNAISIHAPREGCDMVKCRR